VTRSLLLLLLALPSMVLAQTPSCSILNYGIFRNVEAYGSRETQGGREILAKPRASIAQTDHVPGRIGVLFGVTHRFEGIPEGGFIAAAIRHPPAMTADGGTRMDYLLRKEPGAAATGFRFDRPDEIVPGIWTFEFEYEGHILCRQTFVVEAPN
jgi:Domain of unknown function (DUF3859)